MTWKHSDISKSLHWRRPRRERKGRPMAEHVCPWWIGYLLLNPLRRLAQNPQKMLAPYIEPGSIALDVGCAMGFFSLDMARMVGAEGKVVCVDLQQKMIDSLVRRATKAGVIDRIDPRVCDRSGLGLEDLGGTVDFALAFALVHEVRSSNRSMRPCGRGARAWLPNRRAMSRRMTSRKPLLPPRRPASKSARDRPWEEVTPPCSTVELVLQRVSTVSCRPTRGGGKR